MRLHDRQWLLLVIFLTVLLCAPYLRTFYSLGDEGVLLNAATRMLNGERLYIDFFEFLPPGGFLATAGWFGVIGTSVVSARAMAIATIAGIAAFTYLASRKASNSPVLSALLVIGWVAMSQGLWTQVTHNRFTTMLAMIGCWGAFNSTGRGRPESALIAGTAAGAAVMVTPHRGVLAVLAAAVALIGTPLERSILIAYTIGLALVPLLTFAFLAFTGALVPAFNDVIVFTLESYTAIQGTWFGQLAAPWDFPLLAMFPLAAMLMSLVYIRDWRACAGDQLFRGSVAFGLSGFAGCFPRPDIWHIAFAAPLAVPLVAHCAARLIRSSRIIVRTVTKAAVIYLCVSAIVMFGIRTTATLETRVALTPTSRGVVALIGRQEHTAEIIARLAALPPGDAYFFYPYMPLLPYLANRKHIAKHDIFLPGYTRPSQYQETCNIVLRLAQWVVIDREFMDPVVLQRFYPAMSDPEPREKVIFEHALDSRFPIVARDGTFELRRRSADGDASVCDGIAD